MLLKGLVESGASTLCGLHYLRCSVTFRDFVQNAKKIVELQEDVLHLTGNICYYSILTEVKVSKVS